jgi:glucokinase
MRQEHSQVASPLADRIKFEDMTSGDIISAGMAPGEAQDPLCKLVVEKFAEIFAVAVGNAGLSYLPMGGIYLLGGVTNGISNLLLTEHEKFMAIVYQKGRLSSMV